MVELPRLTREVTLRHGFRFFIPVLMLAVLACSKRPPESARPNESPVHLSVDNKYALPVEVSILRDGGSHRLGLVHPGMQADFVVPPTYVGGSSIEFGVTPTVTGPTYRSGPILLAPGETVDLLVAAVLFSSTTSIRRQ